MGRIGPGDRDATQAPAADQAPLVLARSKAIPRAETVRLEPQRGGQHGELLGDEGTKRPERGLGVEPGAHRPHLGDAPGELLRE